MVRDFDRTTDCLRYRTTDLFSGRASHILAIGSTQFEKLDAGEIQVVTSVITLTEVLVKPLRAGETELAQKYKDIFLNVEGLTTVAVSFAIAEQAAQLRSKYSLRTPDAIQMATALQCGATALLTNEVRLPSLPTLPLLILDEILTTQLDSTDSK
jgi:predicted nucleic acid-binding protein